MSHPSSPAVTSSGRFFNPNWFLYRTVRHATHMRKHVWKILSAQRDLLSPQAIEAVTQAMNELRQACEARYDRQSVEAQMTNLENVANKWLKPYPNAALRENIEVLLVAIAVAMGIRTFIAQPFKIPTGSMQPTLYGVTSTNLREQNEFEIPPAWKRFFLYWFTGVSYDHIVAKSDGEFKLADEQPKKFLLFNLKQTFYVGDESYTITFPADNLLRRAGLVDPAGQAISRYFKKGETILKLKTYSGDHLFVDRLTYNFRRPQRGEIIVFETQEIEGMQPDQRGQFYIKRLVGLGDERIRIGNDRHVYINGQRLDSSTPRFENVYSFDPAQTPSDSRYSGHVNGQWLGYGARYFPDEKTEFAIPKGQLMAMGDNTMNSLDSRYWGTLPQESVIGRSFFVYWPIGSQDGRKSRFGWGNR
jgi:signal peptidase I